MTKFLIVLENPDTYLDVDDLSSLPDLLTRLNVSLPEQDWRRTPPMDAMCLSYHGGWVACKTLTKEKNKYAGLLYSNDFSLIPPPSKEEVERLNELIADLKRDMTMEELDDLDG